MILFTYLWKEFAKVFLMCFAGLMTIYVVVDFFEKLRRFMKFDAHIIDILQYFILRTPSITLQIAPLAVLMATLLTLGLLSRNREITAMRACGVSLFKIARPFLVFGALLSVLLLFMSWVVIPSATSAAEYVRNFAIEKKSPVSLKAARPWLQVRGQALMNVELVEAGGSTLRGVRLYQLAPDFRLIGITEARWADYGSKGWQLHDGIERRFLPDGGVASRHFDRRPVALSQVPQDFESWLSVESDLLPLNELAAYIERLQRDGYGFSRLLTDFHARIAFPLVSLIMVCVGIALSLRRMGTRGAGIAVGVGQALVVGFFYWVTNSVAVALGRSGVLMPLLAGWMANLVFLSFGLYLLLKVRY